MKNVRSNYAGCLNHRKSPQQSTEASPCRPGGTSRQELPGRGWWARAWRVMRAPGPSRARAAAGASAAAAAATCRGSGPQWAPPRGGAGRRRRRPQFQFQPQHEPGARRRRSREALPSPSPCPSPGSVPLPGIRLSAAGPYGARFFPGAAAAPSVSGRCLAVRGAGGGHGYKGRRGRAGPSPTCSCPAREPGGAGGTANEVRELHQKGEGGRPWDPPARGRRLRGRPREARRGGGGRPLGLFGVLRGRSGSWCCFFGVSRGGHLAMCVSGFSATCLCFPSGFKIIAVAESCETDRGDF